MTLAKYVWRDYEVDGVPASGPNKPNKTDVREWGASLEIMLSGVQAGGGVVFNTKIEALASLAYPSTQMAWVVGDTANNNGVYQKQGATGLGTWVKVANLPYSFFRAYNTGAGGSTSIVATGQMPASTEALIAVDITETNTVSPISVSFNGGAPLSVKTASNNSPQVGGLVAGAIIAGYIEGAFFRLLSDQASASIVAAAEAILVQTEAAVSGAEAARDLAIEAADLAATVGAGDVPTITTIELAKLTTFIAARQYILAFGNLALGDNGGGNFKRAVSEPAHPGKFRSVDRYLPDGSTDAGNGGWWERFDLAVDPKMFGSLEDALSYSVARKVPADLYIRKGRHTCVGLTNDPSEVFDNQPLLQPQLTYCETNGYDMEIPAGIYPISDGGTGVYCLIGNGQSSIYGTAEKTFLVPKTSVTTAVDIINITPTATAVGFTIEGLKIASTFTGARRGKHGIFINAANALVSMSGMLIHRNYIGRAGPSGGRGLVLYNLPAGEGFYSGLIEFNTIYGGIQYLRTGDSITTRNNTLPGEAGVFYAGIDYTGRAGASMNAFYDNNSTAQGGFFLVRAGIRMHIERNNTELNLPLPGGTINAAFCDLAGGDGPMQDITVSHNLIAPFNGPLAGGALRIAPPNVGAIIDHNTFYYPGGGDTPGIVNEGQHTYIGRQLYDDNLNTGVGTPPAGFISDTGFGTVGYARALAPTAPWSGTPYIRKDMEGTVRLSGIIAGGSAGSTAFTVPDGHRPAVTLRRRVYTDVGSEGAVIEVATTGVVTVVSTSGGNIHIGDLSYEARVRHVALIG